MWVGFLVDNWIVEVAQASLPGVDECAEVAVYKLEIFAGQGNHEEALACSQVSNQVHDREHEHVFHHLQNHSR